MGGGGWMDGCTGGWVDGWQVESSLSKDPGESGNPGVDTITVRLGQGVGARPWAEEAEGERISEGFSEKGPEEERVFTQKDRQTQVGPGGPHL